jgi:anti-sigma regulatory factor (Ser/Thr protein kinase)
MQTTELRDSAVPSAGAGYRHAAAFYRGTAGMLRELVPFIRDGVARDEPTLVVMPTRALDSLRIALGDDADGVQWADMDDVGANPAWIIPAWKDFVDEHPGRRTRGIGQPIFPERSADELTECQHHERLLNPALADSELLLVCPYDVSVLPDDVVGEARRSHPLLYHGGLERRSLQFDRHAAARGFAQAPLPEPETEPAVLTFAAEGLGEVRALVRERMAEVGLNGERGYGLLTAVTELAANSVRHGGGGGTLRVWATCDGRLVCEVADGGRIDDPLVDRRRPHPNQVGGRGLWLANHFCDLVQLRSLPAGVVARLHMRLS